MSELDLIPGDYRQLLRLRLWLLRIGVAALVVLGVAGASRVALAIGIRNQTRAVEALRAAEALSIDRRAQLEALRAEQQALDTRLDILTGLRGGVTARQMLVAVDRAFEAGLWLTDWKFLRAGELVDEPPQTVHAGYFLVVPKSPGDDQPRAWRLETHMEMRGQALDHAALAGFVRRLIEQPEIVDVRILHTQARQYTARQVVDFELAVVVGSAVR